MTEDLEPPLESDERKVGPNDGKEAINEEDREPLIVPNNLPELDLTFIEHTNAGGN